MIGFATGLVLDDDGAGTPACQLVAKAFEHQRALLALLVRLLLMIVGRMIGDHDEAFAAGKQRPDLRFRAFAAVLVGTQIDKRKFLEINEHRRLLQMHGDEFPEFGITDR